jgi:hypothetical protein
MGRPDERVFGRHFLNLIGQVVRSVDGDAWVHPMVLCVCQNRKRQREQKEQSNLFHKCTQWKYSRKATKKT